MAKTPEFDDDNYFNNDASASAFGYLFQAKAATWLFLNHFSSIESISVETKKQDIELSFNDGTKLYAQAKAQQNYSTEDNYYSKLSSALSSLARTIKKATDKLLYINNLANPLNSTNDCQTRFQEISYNDLTLKQKQTVDSCISNMKNKLANDIINKTEKEEDCSSLQNLLNLISGIDLKNLYFCSIYRCDSTSENELLYEIRQKLEQLFPRESFRVQGIFDDWVKLALVSETSTPSDEKKKIFVKDFSWCIVFNSLGIDSFDYNSLLAKQILPDSSSFYVNRVEELLDNEEYDFKNIDWIITNKIINDFDDFMDEHHNLNDYNFIDLNWKKYVDVLSPIGEEEKVRELLTRFIIFKIICKKRMIKEITGRTAI